MTVYAPAGGPGDAHTTTPQECGPHHGADASPCTPHTRGHGKQQKHHNQQQRRHQRPPAPPGANPPRRTISDTLDEKTYLKPVRTTSILRSVYPDKPLFEGAGPESFTIGQDFFGSRGESAPIFTFPVTAFGPVTVIELEFDPPSLETRGHHSVAADHNTATTRLPDTSRTLDS